MQSKWKAIRGAGVSRTIAVMLIASALSACGEEAGQGSGVVITPPAPAPSPTPTPTPTPTPVPASGQGDPIVVPATCTMKDSVRNGSYLQISPVGDLVQVVAIGSSSTSGNGASSAGNGYVAVTANLLTGSVPPINFVVVNAGVAGDSLAKVQDRLQRDALSLNPQVVILQVGVNDALAQPNQGGVDAFRSNLTVMVEQIKGVAPVIIVTGQNFPFQPAYYESYMVAMNQVADRQHVAVFDRFYLMKNIIASGNYSFSSLLASDNFHPNDVMHRCMGKVLAELISTSIKK